MQIFRAIQEEIAKIKRRLDRLERIQIPKVQDWQNLTINDIDWTNDVTKPVQYYKDPYNVVHLRGKIIGSAVTDIAEMPIGYRPDKDMYCAVAMEYYDINQDIVLYTGVITVYTDGIINIPAGPSASRQIHLDSISFRVA